MHCNWKKIGFGDQRKIFVLDDLSIQKKKLPQLVPADGLSGKMEDCRIQSDDFSELSKWNWRKWRKKKRQKVKMAQLMHSWNFFFSSEALINSIFEIETSTNLSEAWKAARNAFTKKSWEKLHFSQNKAKHCSLATIFVVLLTGT